MRLATVARGCFGSALLLAGLTPVVGVCQAPPPTPGDVMIEKHLAGEAAALSQRVLDGAVALADWQARRPRLRQEFLDMLGLWPMPERTPLHATITGTLERETFVVEKLHFQSRPHLYVTGNLYRPKKSAGRLPAVLLVMGHYNRGRNGHKTFLQDQGMWFAGHGYVCLIIDTLERGEIPGEHHGVYSGQRRWWQARGYTPAGVECWNGIRAIDYLVSRPDVDPARIAVTGLSGGGSITFFVAAADERVACAVPASGMTDLESNITNRIMALHCDCQFPLNIYGWEFTTVAALIAPRPLLVVNCHDDLGFPMAANRRILARLRPLYRMHGRPELVDDFVAQGPPGSHAYTPESRAAIYGWINRHLKGDDRPVEDGAFELFREEQLRVFPDDKDLPADAINAAIDETFVPQARVALPEAGEFDHWKRDLLAMLRAISFRNFPERIPASDKAPTPGVYNWRRLLEDQELQTRTTDAGIQVFLRLHRLADKDRPRDRPPALIVLNADEELAGLPDWAKDVVEADGSWAVLAPRGTGPAAWTKATPPNFVERAHALLGRTVDQGRVRDIAATAHWLEGSPGVRVIGRGEAGLLAAYAALFEPSITEVVAIDPPISHAKGPIFLKVLQTLDIPEALGLLAPRPLTLINANDPAFDRTAEIYRLAGAEAKLKRR